MLTTGVMSEMDGISTEGRMGFNAWTTDGVTLDYDAAFDQAYRGYAILMKGTKSVRADSYSFDAASLAITDPGFKPHLVISASAGATGPTTNGLLSLGVATRGAADSISQWCVTKYNLDNNVGAVAQGISTTNSKLVEDIDDTAVSHSGAVSSWDANGFTITRSGAALPVLGKYLAIELPAGQEADCDIVAAPGSATTASHTPDFSDASEFALFCPTRYTSLGYTGGSSSESMGIGAADGNGNEAAANIRDDEGAATSESHSMFYSGAAIIAQDNTGGIVQNATVTNLDSPDIDLNFTTSSSAHYFGWLAVQAPDTELSTASTVSTLSTSSTLSSLSVEESTASTLSSLSSTSTASSESLGSSLSSLSSSSQSSSTQSSSSLSSTSTLSSLSTAPSSMTSSSNSSSTVSTASSSSQTSSSSVSSISASSSSQSLSESSSVSSSSTGGQVEYLAKDPDDNMLLNPNFNGTDNWTLAGTAVYDSTVSKTADGTGSVKITGTSTASRVSSAFASIQGTGTGYYQFTYHTLTHLPARVNSAQVKKSSGGNTGGGFGMPMEPGAWTEQSRVVWLDAGTTGSAKVEVIARNEPDDFVGPFWVDEVSLCKIPDYRVRMLGAAPTKDSLDGRVRLDWLGNWSVENPDTGIHEDLFPWMMHTDGGRSDHQPYADNGWNVNVWASSLARLQRSSSVGMYSLFKMAEYTNTSGSSYGDYAALHTAINAILAEPDEWKTLLGYFWDNENSWEEWAVPDRVIDVLKSKENLPVFVVDGNEKTSQCHARNGKGDVFATYVSSGIDDGNALGASRMDAQNRFPGMTKPGAIAQINSTGSAGSDHPGEMRAICYISIMDGARGVSYFADNLSGEPTLENSTFFVDMPFIVAEEAAIHDIVKAPHWTETWGATSSNSWVLCRTREAADGRKTVWLVNTSSSPQTTRIDLTGSHGASTGDPVINLHTGLKVTEVYVNEFDVTLPGAGTNAGTAVLHINGTDATAYRIQAEFSTEKEEPLANPTTWETGAFTVVQTNDDMSVLSGELIVNEPPVTKDWTGMGMVNEDAVTREFGLLGKWKINFSTMDSFIFGWTNSAAVSHTKTFGLEVSPTRLMTRPGGANVILIDSALSTDTDYEFLMAFGDQADNEAAVLIKGGSYTDWTLLAITPTHTSTSMYTSFSNVDAAAKIDYIREPTLATASWYPKPILSDGFTAANSTTLPLTDGAGGAVTAGAGHQWTEALGDWEITSNRLHSVGAVTSILTHDTGQSDLFIKTTVQAPSGGTHGIVFRYTDANNYWIFGLDVTSGDFLLIEVASGTPTTRATITDTHAANTDATLRVWCSGNQIRVWGQNQQAEYTSTANQTATIVGAIGDGVDAVQFDNYEVWLVDQKGQPPEF
jgi:hypothetical protein